MTAARPIPTPIPDDVKARFWAKVDVRGPDECWEWTAFKGKKGYGRFYIGGERMIQPHRLSFILAGRALPVALVIDHLCRNPACVNPAHLEAVTPRENTRRGITGHHMKARGRAMTHCKRGHRYTPENTIIQAQGNRRCHECKLLLQRQRRRAKRLERALEVR